MRKAKGTETPSGKRQIAITFEPDLFRWIAEEAVKNELTFSEQVRIYIKEGKYP